ncbi:MAG: ankyrin repeat domain-containing protein [Candidatus Babeliales bacterium]
MKLKNIFFLCISLQFAHNIYAMDPTWPRSAHPAVPAVASREGWELAEERDTNHAIWPRYSLGVAGAPEEQRRMDVQEPLSMLAQIDARLLRAAADSNVQQAVADLIQTTSINAQDPHGRTRLHLATWLQETTCIEQLLQESPGLIDIADGTGETALHFAVSFTTSNEFEASQQFKVATLLLTYNANPMIETTAGQTTLDYAQRLPYNVMLCRALDNPALAIIDKKLLLAASHTVFEGAIKQLCENKTITAQDKQTGKTRLHYAVQIRDYSSTELLLKHPMATSTVNAQDINGETPLHLLLASTPINEFDASQLLKQVTLFLKQGANPLLGNKEKENALHYAIKHHSSDRVFQETRPKLIDLLIEHGVPIDSQNGSGETALHYVFRPHAELESFCFFRHKLLLTLLKHRANPNTQNWLGETSFHFLLKTYEESNSEAVQHMLSAGADPNIQNRLGVTPFYELLLSTCTDAKRKIAILIFFYHDANPNRRTKEGFGALHLAVGLQQLEWVKVLLARTASVFNNATDTSLEHRPTYKNAPVLAKGKTPLDLAEEMLPMPGVTTTSDAVFNTHQLRLAQAREKNRTIETILDLLKKDNERKLLKK